MSAKIWLSTGFIVLLVLYIPLSLVLPEMHALGLSSKHEDGQLVGQAVGTLALGFLLLSRREQLGWGYWVFAGSLLLLDAFLFWMIYGGSPRDSPWLFKGL